MKTGSCSAAVLAWPRRPQPPAPSPTRAAALAPAKAVKRSYKEQRELDALPARIDALETEQRQIHALLADGSLYASDAARAAALTQRNVAIEEELMTALERWEALGARRSTGRAAARGVTAASPAATTINLSQQAGGSGS